MMGGGGGGYSPSIDIAKLTERANQRIQSALSDNKLTVFVCHKSDVESLQGKIAASAFSQKKVSISYRINSLNEDLAKASLVVFYVDRSQEHKLIDEAIVLAGKLKIANFFVYAREPYSLPNRVLQFRVRTMSWDQLVEIVVGG